MIANALISRPKEKLPLTDLQFTSNNKKSKNLYLRSMHKSYYSNANKPVNIIIYIRKTKRFVENNATSLLFKGHGTEHTTVKWPTVHCFPFICLYRNLAWDFEGERMEEKLERQRRSKLGGSGGILLQKTFKFRVSKMPFVVFFFFSR